MGGTTSSDPIRALNAALQSQKNKHALVFAFCIHTEEKEYLLVCSGNHRAAGAPSTLSSPLNTNVQLYDVIPATQTLPRKACGLVGNVKLNVLKGPLEGCGVKITFLVKH